MIREMSGARYTASQPAASSTIEAVRRSRSANSSYARPSSGLAIAVTSRNIVHGVTASVRVIPNSAPKASEMAGNV